MNNLEAAKSLDYFAWDEDTADFYKRLKKACLSEGRVLESEKMDTWDVRKFTRDAISNNRHTQLVARYCRDQDDDHQLIDSTFVIDSNMIDERVEDAELMFNKDELGEGYYGEDEYTPYNIGNINVYDLSEAVKYDWFIWEDANSLDIEDQPREFSQYMFIKIGEDEWIKYGVEHQPRPPKWSDDENYYSEYYR